MSYKQALVLYNPSPDQISHSWPEYLSDVFKKAGLHDVSSEDLWPHLSRHRYNVDVALLVYEEIIDGLALKKKATPEKIFELRSRLAKASVECQEGAAWWIRKIVTTARTPG